ncbi:MAG: hypothetical protein Q7T14_12855 [Aestuariivirga sp.]|nr:hypothetical protein [Aestuariivirga sp.]
MLPRIISAAAFALMASTLLVPTSAEAGSRWRFLNPGYYFYDPPPRDFYADEYDDDEYYEDDERPLTYYEPDNDYYEPRYEGEEPVYIAPKKKKIVKAAPAPKPVVKKSVASTEKKAVTSTETKSVASVEKKAVAPVEKKTASAAPGMSCDKAGQIVSGYGFTSVKPTTCTGQVFAFNATRSGKAYMIKLSSASGELTEVKKVQ